MSVMTSGETSPTPTREDADIRRVLDLVGEPPPPGRWPTLVVLVGPPGSGKTTFCRALRARMPLVVIDSDRVRAALVDAPDYSFRESQRVARAIRGAIGDLLNRGITVVLDDTNLTEWERQPLYTLCQRHEARLVLVQVTAPMQELLDRVRRLAEGEPRETGEAVQFYERMAGRQEPITRAHFTVDTSSDIDRFVEGLVLDLEEGEL